MEELQSAYDMLGRQRMLTWARDTLEKTNPHVFDGGGLTPQLGVASWFGGGSATKSLPDSFAYGLMTAQAFWEVGYACVPLGTMDNVLSMEDDMGASGGWTPKISLSR